MHWLERAMWSFETHCGQRQGSPQWHCSVVACDDQIYRRGDEHEQVRAEALAPHHHPHSPTLPRVRSEFALICHSESLVPG